MSGKFVTRAYNIFEVDWPINTIAVNHDKNNEGEFKMTLKDRFENNQLTNEDKIFNSVFTINNNNPINETIIDIVDQICSKCHLEFYTKNCDDKIKYCIVNKHKIYFINENDVKKYIKPGIFEVFDSPIGMHSGKVVIATVFRFDSYQDFLNFDFNTVCGWRCVDENDKKQISLSTYFDITTNINDATIIYARFMK